MFFDRFRANTPQQTPTVSIDELLSRGVKEVFPDKKSVASMLEGKKVTIYLGIDPTGPSLHLGHAIVLKKLQEFQNLGHQVILLIGDFTGMIGDPTDKSATRKRLTRKEVLSNAKQYEQQASRFLRFSGENKAQLKYNSTWLSSMQFGDVLELASHMTVDQMLKRDMFAKRMEEEKPIYIHEFLYPLLQGFDSVAMDVDGEIGGNDQMFNMLAGRTLLRQMKDKEKFVLTAKLLEDESGKKMGKTEGNMVRLDEDPNQMFGKIMSWSDGMIVPGLLLCTYLPRDEIDDLKTKLEKKELHPKEAKERLAQEIVSIYHGPEAAEQAKQTFNETFAQGAMPKDAPTISATRGDTLAEVLVLNGAVRSKKELERLVASKAVTNMTTDTPVSDMRMELTESGDYRIGKKKFVSIEVK